MPERSRAFGLGGDHEGDRLSAFLDDELSEEAGLEVARHLDHCDDCLAELEEIRTTREALRGLPRVEPPPALFAIDESALRAHRTRQRIRRVAASVAGGVMVVAAVAFAVGDDGGAASVDPPIDHYVADHVARTGGGPVPVPVDLGPPGR